MRKGGIILLAGCTLTFSMYPLTAIDLNSDFSLEKSLKFRHLPSIPSEPDPFEFLKAYVKTCLREEVMQEGLTSNLGSFTRFLEMASFSLALVLNISEVAREASLERKRFEKIRIITSIRPPSEV